MDQELVAFFEKKFGETAQQIASLREETAEQFASFGGELASFRGEFVVFREDAARRFESVEESLRHTQITVEQMRGEIQLLAEGVSGFDEKLEAVRKELRAEIGEVRDLLTVSYRDLTSGLDRAL